MESNLKTYDLMAKLLILGDATVGKSSILSRFCDGTFSYNIGTTIGKFVINYDKT